MDVQFIFFKGILVLQGLICYKIKSIYLSFAYEITMMNTPVLIWSRKLRIVGPGQYLDKGPIGNTRCAKLLFLSIATDNGTHCQVLFLNRRLKKNILKNNLPCGESNPGRGGENAES